MGGFGVVVKAFNTKADQYVAIKKILRILDSKREI